MDIARAKIKSVIDYEVFYTYFTDLLHLGPEAWGSPETLVSLPPGKPFSYSFTAYAPNGNRDSGISFVLRAMTFEKTRLRAI